MDVAQRQNHLFFRQVNSSWRFNQQRESSSGPMHSSPVTLLRLFYCLRVKSPRGLSQLSEFVQLPHRAPESSRSLLSRTATIIQLEPAENTRLQAHDSLQTIILVVQQSFWKLSKKRTCLCALFIPEIKQACLKAKPPGSDKSSGYVDVRRKCSIRSDSADTALREEQHKTTLGKNHN